MEDLMAKQVEMFRQNLEYFRAVAKDTDSMKESLQAISRNGFDLLSIQRQIQLDQARVAGRI